MAREVLCISDLGTGFCYDAGTSKINTIGGTQTPITVVDTNTIDFTASGTDNHTVTGVVKTQCEITSDALGLKLTDTFYDATSMAGVTGAVTAPVTTNRLDEVYVVRDACTLRGFVNNHTQKMWSGAFGFGGQNILHTTAIGTIVPVTDQTNLSFTKPASSRTNQDVEFQLHININERLRYTSANWNTVITTIGTDFETLWTPMIRFNNGTWLEMSNRYISLLPPNMAYTSPTGQPYIQYDKDLYETYTFVNMPNGTYDVDFALRLDYAGASYLDTTVPFVLKTTTVWESQAHALYED